MTIQYIETRSDFESLCDRLDSEPWVAFDTEFVAEDSYRPLLCLLQVATPTSVAIIDTLETGSIDRFWNLLVKPDKTVVVHAGREESLFCYRAIGKSIPGLFDVQIAAGFVGSEYPASYGNLVQRYCSDVLDKEETRSDWRQRPLSQRQINYAAQDVTYLFDIHTQIIADLKKRGREAWVQEEITQRTEAILQSEDREQWHRMSGVQGLPQKSLGIARQLWLWREEKAQARDIPARRIIRDDLIIELAKRGSSDTRRIASLRGMNYRHLKSYIDELAEVIDKSSEVAAPDWPKKTRYYGPQPSSMLTQFLGAGLAQICRHSSIAPSIVGTTEDLKNFAIYQLCSQSEGAEVPKLSTGWRNEVIGTRLDDLLHGRLAIKLENPLDDIPITFCKPADSNGKIE